MSISPVVTLGYGANAGASIALVVTEGYGFGNVAPPPPAIIGGMVKRHKGRFAVEINGQRFVANSIPALEAIVARWRRLNPANDPAPQPQPESRKEVVPDQKSSDYDTGLPAADTATPPAEIMAPGAVSPAIAAATDALLRAMEDERRRLEDDDAAALLAILDAIAS